MENPKRIIELPDKVVEAIQNGEDYRYDIHTAIAQSKPYDEAEVWRKSNELLEKRLKYLGNSKDGWIPVSEKLPEPLVSVIATDNYDVFVAWYNEEWKSSDSQFDKHTPVVAWRPIPRYAESEKGGAE